MTFFSSGFVVSGVSNFIIFRSGSGFFGAVAEESSFVEAVPSFPNFNFICTPPYLLNL
jgi:hypothetical protein